MKHLILTILLTTAAWAQTGPQVPCTGCEYINEQISKSSHQYYYFHRFFLPESGHWYNPDQPGTGVTLEVQQDTVAGYYFGYKEDGSQAWYQFAGQLELLANEQGRWRLQVPLYEYSNGQCIGCDYQPPAEPVERHQLTLIFQQRSLASMQVDELPAVNIQPIEYGLETSSLFPEVTDFRMTLPTTFEPSDPGWETSTWVFAFSMDSGNFITKRSYIGMFIEGQPPFNTDYEDENILLSADLFWDRDDGYNMLQLARLRCYKESPWPEQTGSGPICSLLTHPEAMLNQYAGRSTDTLYNFVFPYADLSGGRMSGYSLERENFLFTAYRITHN